MGAQERSKVRKRMTSPHSFYPETLKKSMSLCCGDSWSCLASLYSSLVLKPSFWIIWVTLYPSNKLPCCSDSTKLGSVLATCLSSGCWSKHCRLGGWKQQKCSHSSRAWKFKVKAPAWLCSDKSPLPSSWHMLTATVSSCDRRGEGTL